MNIMHSKVNDIHFDPWEKNDFFRYLKVIFGTELTCSSRPSQYNENQSIVHV